MAVTVDGRTWPAEEEAHVRPRHSYHRKPAAFVYFCESAKYGATMAADIAACSAGCLLFAKTSTAQLHSPQVLNDQMMRNWRP